MVNIGVIGAGASGLVAAIEASDRGANVTIFERKDRIGKKILATGNGRCNFTNRNMSSKYYYCDDTSFIDDVYKRFGHDDLCKYFMNLGLLIKDKNGYFYPACEQASALLDTLRMAVSERNITVNTDSYVTDISYTKKGKFRVSLDSGSDFSFDKVIVSTGGKAGIGKKEYANGYDLLKNMGHSVTKLYPALTQIRCKESFFKSVSGVRSDATISVFENGERKMFESGEVLFTDYGISGIVSFQVSHFVASTLAENKKIDIILDLIPGIGESDLMNYVISKKLLHDSLTLEEFLTGIHNKKLNMEIIRQSGLKPSVLVKDIDNYKLTLLVKNFKNFRVNPIGVNDFDQAQVTGGGVLLSEVSSDFESVYNPGLYITGEILDVDGICGGYNLQWAFSSGIIAGRAASILK